jgi:cell division protein FtsL
MEDWDKFRAVLVERTEPAKRRRQRLARATKILVVFATVFLVIVLVVLVHERMPALVG